MEVKKGHVYAVSLSIGVSMAGVAICIWVSVPRVASDGIVMPDPLGAAVYVLSGNVWITNFTTFSIRSGKSLNMPSSLLSSACTDINSSSVSACVVPSFCTFLVVAGGISEVSRAFLSFASRISEVNYVAFKYRHLRGVPLSALTSNDSHCWEDEKALGTCEKEQEGAGIPEGSEARVSESASLDPGVLRRWHNSVIKIGNGRDVSLFLALMAISSEVSSPSATDEAKPEFGSDVNVPLLNGSSCVHPPQGGVRNHQSQPTLRIIQGLNNT
ncbi:hypothetical protein H5410_021220 [Solanum commersonii]|uniref:Uncharacterized protein n=1 Tax=Solanum commersonii TaxID=4109 RepID=A0A9J5ZAD0_SOLCO|nr:hypothetical protein H5410_021220 [Solanum commersonii]